MLGGCSCRCFFALTAENCDYITEYQSVAKNEQINKITAIFDLDKNKLKELMNAGVDESNINEFGRFDDLVESVDKVKAKEYFDLIWSSYAVIITEISEKNIVAMPKKSVCWTALFHQKKLLISLILFSNSFTKYDTNSSYSSNFNCV